ncbi:hypothetical protein [Peribacillus sp. Hz7]|uniref:hypothetical protein n=1 Tax=Peribacillus sp. Hz7 TaxID=3344873 RepID=UPI0035CB1A15
MLKLLLCMKCNHIFNLDYKERVCDCNSTQGKYINQQLATYSGEHAIPVGFTNDLLVIAIKNQPQSGLGELFTAFVIPKICPTFIFEKLDD